MQKDTEKKEDENRNIGITIGEAMNKKEEKNL